MQGRSVRGGVVDLSIDEKKIAALQRNLKEAGDRTLQRELRRGLKDAVKPMVPALRSAALSIPSESGRSRGLRAAMAAAVTVRYSSSKRHPGVRVHIPMSKMPEEWRRMPRRTDSFKGWRHPVFGDREVWVEQKGKPGWWMFTARYYGRAALDDVHKALDRVAAQITR